jgi:hypothetical protein
MTVIPFPNRRVVRPAVSECVEAVALCEHRPELLLICASWALNVVRREPCVSEQVAVNRLTVAFLALAELLGVTKAEEALS